MFAGGKKPGLLFLKLTEAPFFVCVCVIGVPATATNRMDLISTHHEINRLARGTSFNSFVSLQQFVAGACCTTAHKCIVPYDMLRVFGRNVAPWFAPNAGN